MTRAEKIKAAIKKLRNLNEQREELLDELAISTALEEQFPDIFGSGSVSIVIETGPGPVNNPRKVRIRATAGDGTTHTVVMTDLNDTLFVHFLGELRKREGRVPPLENHRDVKTRLAAMEEEPA